MQSYYSVSFGCNYMKSHTNRTLHLYNLKYCTQVTSKTSHIVGLFGYDQACVTAGSKSQ